MKVLAISLSLLAAPALKADELSMLHGAARECTRNFVERPAQSIYPWDFLLTYEESFSRELEQTIAVRVDDDGHIIAKYYRAAGKTYYSQCVEILKQNPAAIANRSLMRRELHSLSYDLWTLSQSNCPMITRDVTTLPIILQASADALRNRIEKPKGSAPKSETTTILVRTDGPYYQVRMRTDELGTIEVLPGVDSDLEHLVQAMLKHANECAANTATNKK
jgi:hypothetical protein